MRYHNFQVKFVFFLIPLLLCYLIHYISYGVYFSIYVCGVFFFGYNFKFQYYHRDHLGLSKFCVVETIIDLETVPMGRAVSAGIKF